MSAMLLSLTTGVIGVVLSYAIAIPIGIEISRRKGSKIDGFVNILSAAVYALPTIGIAILTKLFFTLPSSFDVNNPFHYLPPTIAIILIFTPSIIINVRRYTCDEATNDYIRFAASNGLSSIRQYYLHVFRVSGVKILRSFPSQIIYAMIGISYYTESVFRINGFAKLSLASASTSSLDMNALLCVTTISAFFTVCA
jgi:oligopeptide transport system permease protein